MSEEHIQAFLAHAQEHGVSPRERQRLFCAVHGLYQSLPGDKALSRERLSAWRRGMEDRSYAPSTIQNHVKAINRYLDFAGCSALRFRSGRAREIQGMTFGYLTALEPTEKRSSYGIIWLCRCKCGTLVELPASRLIQGNTLSCGCLHKEHFQRANKYFQNTSLRQSLEEKVESSRAVSGYTGIAPKNGKWKACIRYKGKSHSLGCYTELADALKARARAKELVQADALGLLDFYEQLHSADPLPPSRATEPRREFPAPPRPDPVPPTAAARRSDNRSGCTGVSRVGQGWEARICHRGIRYILGSFPCQEDAVKARRQAEKDCQADPEGFAQRYGKSCKHYAYRRK